MKSHEFLQNHSNVTLSKICVYECLMNIIYPLTKTVYIVFESYPQINTAGLKF